jgi:RNA polymerase sigma factor (sigma-70 family)
MSGAATDSQPLLPGSQRELGELYAAHHGWLTHWLHGRLRCPQDAADLSQDTFLRLILGEQSLEALRDPRADLMVIASRLMINRHHRRQVEEEALRQVAILVETRDQRGPAEIAAARDLLVTVLKLLVDELPEKPRRAFLMARLEGLTYRQIARRLSVSESSVKQYLARAFAHCHARLYDSLADAPCLN